MSAGDSNSGFHVCTERVFAKSVYHHPRSRIENGKKNCREGTLDYTAWLSFVY